MEYKTLGNTGWQISRIGYGAWGLGIKGWQGVNEYQGRKTLRMAYEKGINFFDTAPIYGLGKSEEIIGEELSNIRDKIYIATKFGLNNHKGKVLHDVSREAILTEIGASLKRLKTDYIDLYQLHWKDGKTPFKTTFETLYRLKEQGFIRAIGVCNMSMADLKEAITYAPISSVQNQYNYLQREVEEELLPFCDHHGIGFIAYSALAQGLLTGKINGEYHLSKHDVRRFNDLFTNQHLFREKIRQVQQMQSPVATAINYLREKKEVSTILISMTKPRHLEENVKIF